VRLASFHADGKDRIGISKDERTRMEISGPRSIVELVETGQEIRPTAQHIRRTMSLGSADRAAIEDLLPGSE
jgi:hypothetical protein